MYRLPQGQKEKSTDPKDYSIRIVVFGSRSFADKKMFHEKLLDYMEQFDSPILFISGAARSGADDYIIRWCKKYGYPCKEYPANWTPNGPNTEVDKTAGFKRNEHMAKVANYGLAFYDGESNGTAHMLDQCELNKIRLVVHLFKNENAKASHKKDLFVG